MKSKIFIILLIVLIITSCGSGDKAEDEFINKVKSQVTTDSLYILVADLHDMISTTKPNLIIRCKVTERFDTIKKWSSLSTPYEFEIAEVYLGDINKAGDKIIFNASYGVSGEMEGRKSYHPILRVGEEYIIFLRVDSINGELTYYLAYTPASVLIVKGDKFTNPNPEWDYVFEPFDNRVSKLIKTLTKLIEQHDYDISMEVV